MSSIDLHAVPEQLDTPRRVAARRDWGKAALRVLGGFVLTGFFLGLSVAAFAAAGVYGLIEFARLY